MKTPFLNTIQVGKAYSPAPTVSIAVDEQRWKLLIINTQYESLLCKSPSNEEVLGRMNRNSMSREDVCSIGGRVIEQDLLGLRVTSV
jgi:hypothetical protein